MTAKGRIISRARRLGARLATGSAAQLTSISHKLSPPPPQVLQAFEPAPPSYYEVAWEPTSDRQAREMIATYSDEERFERTGREEAERLIPYVTPESTVLDLGCGIGRVALYVAPHCRTLWAVDVSEKMLALARQRLSGASNVRYAMCLDTTVPEVPNQSVDFAYSIIVLQHLEREDAFVLVEDVFRMLRPGGKAFFTWPNLADKYYLDSFLAYARNGESTHRSRARIYTTTELELILPAVGFTGVEVHDAPNIVTICAR